PPTDLLDRLTFIEGDIRDARLLADIVRDQDVILHCAAQTSHPLSLEDPVLDTDINCLASIRLLEAVRRHNPAATIVFPSTSTVIGRAEGEIIDEDRDE